MASFFGSYFHKIKSNPNEQPKAISANKALINPPHLYHGISVPKNPKGSQKPKLRDC